WVVTAVGAGAIAIAVVAGAAVWALTRPAPPAVVRTSIATSRTAALTIGGFDRDVIITPDGSPVIYIGNDGTRQQLFVRALDQLESVGIGNVGQPRGVFVSPDGRWIGYFDGTATLKKVAMTGGAPVTLTRQDGTGPRGGTWGPNGTIVFATAAS